MIEELKILYQHGRQYIPDPMTAGEPLSFKGYPEISSANIDEKMAVGMCPTGAIKSGPFSIDMGKCTFCGECALSYPEKIKFTGFYKTASNVRERLIIAENLSSFPGLDPEAVRKEIRGVFSRSLKLRQISAAGDNSAEWELNACGNPNFDMGRYGIEFVASPRHADGIVITGPISENMANATRICYEAIPDPKIVVLNGTDAISGGIFAESKALNRSFLDEVNVDLYVPGNPPHPLTFINGILELTRMKWKK